LTRFSALRWKNTLVWYMKQPPVDRSRWSGSDRNDIEKSNAGVWLMNVFEKNFNIPLGDTQNKEDWAKKPKNEILLHKKSESRLKPFQNQLNAAKQCFNKNDGWTVLKLRRTFTLMRSTKGKSWN
jgi:hypothetical protein